MTREELLKAAKPILFNTEMVKAILDGRKTVTRRVVKPQPPEGYICAGIQLDSTSGNKNVGKIGFTNSDYRDTHYFKPQYKTGDILYVRETWQCINPYSEREIVYKASCDQDYASDIGKWLPSIHMPKEYARIFLKVTGVRIERLQEITEEQALKEGITKLFDYLSKEEYRQWATNVKRVSGSDVGKQDEQSWSNFLWHGHYGEYGSGNKLSDAWEYQCSGYDSAIDSFSSLWNSTLPLKDWDKYGWNANPYVVVYEFGKLEVE